MSEFDPSEHSVLVYDALNNRLVDWDWVRADQYWEEAIMQTDGMVRWQDLLLAGWRKALR